MNASAMPRARSDAITCGVVELSMRLNSALAKAADVPALRSSFLRALDHRAAGLGSLQTDATQFTAAIVIKQDERCFFQIESASFAQAAPAPGDSFHQTR